jgi:thiamine-monophosphate kinase
VREGITAEFEIIEAIRARLAPDAPGVLLGVGDDTAVLRTGGAGLLVTTDTMVEDVHFRFAWQTPEEVGRKAAGSNLSDVAAMGGRPRWATLALSLPRGVAAAAVLALVDGVVARLAVHGATLVGGDLTGSPGPWVVTVTLLGEEPAAGALRRCGARPGDVVWVAGRVGDAALALRRLEAGARPAGAERGQPPWDALLDPLPQCAFGAALGAAGVATAAIDVSDGLCQDLGHVCRASGCGAEVALDAVPRSDALRAAQAAGEDTWPLVAGGGEDYALLFTAPESAEPAIRRAWGQAGRPSPLLPVGRIVAGAPEVRPTVGGRPYRPPRAGWDHFLGR